MKSAEIKYLVSIALGKAFFRVFGTGSQDAMIYVTSVMLCSLINAAICRSSRTSSLQKRMDVDPSDLHLRVNDRSEGPGGSYSIEDLCAIDAVVLAALATSFTQSISASHDNPNLNLDNIILQIKECLVREKAGRYVIGERQHDFFIFLFFCQCCIGLENLFKC